MKISTGGLSPRQRAYLPLAVVLAVVLLGLLRIVSYHWREGTVLIGGSLILAALLRTVLTDTQIGLLALRSKVIDVALYGGFGAVLMFVALTIPADPFS